MAQCTNCGAQATGRFCPNCGAQIPQEPAAAPMAPPPLPPQGAGPQPPQFQGPQPMQYQVPPPQFQQSNPPYGPQGSGPMPGQFPPAPPQQQKTSGSKVVLIILGVIGGLILLAVVAVLALSAFIVDKADDIVTPIQPAVTTVTSSAVTNLTITDKVNDQTQEPQRALTTVPPATDQIFAAIKVSIKQGQVLSAKWYYNNNHQAHLDVDLPADQDFKGWASFDISNGGKPWPNGSYKVEIYLDGKKVAETPFSVK